MKLSIWSPSKTESSRASTELCNKKECEGEFQFAGQYDWNVCQNGRRGEFHADRLYFGIVKPYDRSIKQE